MDKIAKGLEADVILTCAGKTKWWTSTIIVIGDLQSECVEPVSEYLCKFLYGKSVLVRLPDLTRICRRRLRN